MGAFNPAVEREVLRLLEEALEQLRLEPEFQPQPEPQKKSFFSRVKDAFAG